MPLRDHFHPPLDDKTSWDMLHGGWPMVIVQNLFEKLPKGYTAGPNIHLGRQVEVDVGTFEGDDADPTALPSAGGEGGVAVRPGLSVRTDLNESDVYEVRVYDARRGRQLVAAVEIISPSNKDRPEHRRAFVEKATALLREGVSLTVVDLVTCHHFNLYAELLASVNKSDPSLGADPPAIYAVTCRWTKTRRSGRLDAWPRPLEVGRPLPTMPMWLTDTLAVPLELEATYEDACRVLNIE